MSFYYDALDENDEPTDDITCRYCQETNLHFADHGSGLKLYNEDCVQHICKPSLDDFEVVVG